MDKDERIKLQPNQDLQHEVVDESVTSHLEIINIFHSYKLRMFFCEIWTKLRPSKCLAKLFLRERGGWAWRLLSKAGGGAFSKASSRFFLKNLKATSASPKAPGTEGPKKLQCSGPSCHAVEVALSFEPCMSSYDCTCSLCTPSISRYTCPAWRVCCKWVQWVVVPRNCCLCLFLGALTVRAKGDIGKTCNGSLTNTSQRQHPQSLYM